MKWYIGLESNEQLITVCGGNMLTECSDLYIISCMCEITTKQSEYKIWINCYPELQFPIESSVWDSVQRVTADGVRGIEYA